MSNTKEIKIEPLRFVSCVCCKMPVDTADHDESRCCDRCGNWICTYCLDDSRHVPDCKGAH